MVGSPFRLESDLALGSDMRIDRRIIWPLKLCA